MAPQQAVMIAEDPPPGGPGISYGYPIFYQRLAPPGYVYGEYFRPRHRFLPAKYYDPPSKREYYYKAEEPERRQCRSLGRRRSVSYAKQPFKPVSLREDASSYYGSDTNSASRSKRVERNDLYHVDRQYEESDENAEANQNERFADEKYPAVLANFKIGSKLDKKSVPESSKLLKREYRQNDTSVAKEKGSLTDSASISETDSDGKVAEELRDILDYMGLIDEDNMPNAKAAVDKRQESKKGAAEDENMEEGENKISLSKEERRSTTKDRSKREDKSTASTEVSVSSSTVSECEHQKDKSLLTAKDPPDRSKRESKRQDDNSTMSHANLEESDNDANDYEKRMERQIQNRINALKEEVKREIASLKAQEAAQAVHNLNDDSQRKKRQVFSTLVDEESSDLDPALHPDGALKPHVRKRRSAKVEAQLQNTSHYLGLSENHTEPTATHLNSIQNSTYSKINYGNYTKNTGINDIQNYIVTFDRVPNNSDLIEENSITEVRKSTAYNSGHSLHNNYLDEKRDLLYTAGNSTLEMTSANGKSRKKREAMDMNYIPSRYVPGYVALPAAAMSYVPYNGNYEADEAEGGMDYDRYYGRLANVDELSQVGIYPAKRSVAYGQGALAEGAGQARSRRRRDQDSAAFHGGGAAENHASLLRARRMGSKPRVRRKAYYKRDLRNRRPQTLNDMSDTDLFGALPQSYDGELSRFKRVRRSRKKG